MTVFKNEGRWDTSNVWFDGNEIRRYDKKKRTPEMRYIDYGLGVLRAEAFVDGLTMSRLIWRMFTRNWSPRNNLPAMK